MVSPSSQSGAAQAALLPSWQHLVGAPNSLRQQAATGCVPSNSTPGHTDSWGIGWFDAAGQVSLVHQVGSADASGYYVMTAEAASRGGGGSGPARTLIGHLRKASLGAINSENAHPVRADIAGGPHSSPLLIAHNGTIWEPLLLSLRDDLEEADRLRAARSDNDTVVLSAWLGMRCENVTDLFDSIAASLTDLLQRAQLLADRDFAGDRTKTYSGLNLLLAHTSGLYALRQFSKEPGYYTMYVRPLTESPEGGFLVASERTDENESWQLLEPGVLTLFPAASGNPVRTAKIAVS